MARRRVLMRAGTAAVVAVAVVPSVFASAEGLDALATTSSSPSAGVTIVDDTSFLTVTVPADWDEHNTSSGLHDDGSDRPQISAAPNLQQFFETFDGSGLYVVAGPSTTDPATVLALNDWSGVCSDGGVMAYDDGRFIGQQQIWSNCDGGTTRLVHLAVRPVDNSFGLFLAVSQVTPDDAQLLRIVGSLGVVPGAVYAAPVAPVPLVPSGAVSPELLIAPAIPMTTVADDTGQLSMSVPSAWTQNDGVPDFNDDGSDRPRVTAASDLDGYYTDWLVPGVQVIAFPFNSDPSALLQNLGWADQCQNGGVQSFDSGSYIGLMQTWSACGGTPTRDVQLAISPTDESATLHVEVQLPDADNAPLQAVLSSLQFRTDAVVQEPSPTTTSSPPTTSVVISTTTTAPPATTTSPSATAVSTTSSSVAVPLTTLPVVATSSVVESSQSTLPPSPDNDHLFTSGEIEIPPGEPGQLSVVLGNTTDAGDLMIVVRNGRNEAVPGVLVVVNGFDDAGELTFNVIVPIAVVLGPDEWAFGQAIAPNLDRTADFNVEFFDPDEIGEPVNLEITDAELRDGVITGTVVNTSGVAVVDFVSVHVACFNESLIVAAQDAAVDTEVLRLSESASFTTTLIDPAACSSFAIYAGGFPEDETTSVQASESLVATVPDTVAKVMTSEVTSATMDEEALAAAATSTAVTR